MRGIWGAEIPITGIAGDQHAALFGQTCLNAGDVKNTYGTGCFLLKNIGPGLKITQSRLLTTLAWYMDGQATYALEGSVFNAGAAVEWLMHEMKLADSVEEINAICADTPDTDGAYFVPAFSGLGAPYWDMYARGTVCGMNLSTGKRHIVRAVMESVAFQSRDVIDHMTEASGLAVPALKVDGGVSRSDFTMQFQADLLHVPVERPKVTETTAQGVYYMAGLGTGLFKSLDAIKHLRVVDRVFTPQAPAYEMDERYRLWRKAVERARNWAV
jgi:glycerol kinase